MWRAAPAAGQVSMGGGDGGGVGRGEGGRWEGDKSGKTGAWL